MKLIGLMPCRNEDWVLGFSARAALMWCDEIVVLDHASTDTSRWVIDAIASEDRSTDRISRVAVSETKWDEMSHRQMMLEVARRRGAAHIAIIDADEVLTGNLLRTVREDISFLRQRQMLELPGYNLRGSLNQFHSNGIWSNRWFSTAFQDIPEAHWSGDNFHQRKPRGLTWSNRHPVEQMQGGTLHLWGASKRRLRARHAMYKITERLRWPNRPIAEIERMYNLWRSPKDCQIAYPNQNDWARPWTFADVPASWWEPYKHLMPYLNIDAEPWQEAWVRQQVAEHEADRFKGLDLFGIA